MTTTENGYIDITVEGSAPTEVKEAVGKLIHGVLEYGGFVDITSTDVDNEPLESPIVDEAVGFNSSVVSVLDVAKDVFPTLFNTPITIQVLNHQEEDEDETEEEIVIVGM